MYYTEYTDNTYYTDNTKQREKEYIQMINTIQNIQTINNIQIEFNPTYFIDYVNYLDGTNATKDTYLKATKRFADFLKDNGIVNPTFNDCMNYKNNLIKSGLKANTIALYIVSVKKFFNWLAITGLYPNVAIGLKGVKIDREHKKDNLTQDQSIDLLKSINRETINGKRDFALISTMLIGGLRDIEIQRSNIEDIRIKGNNYVLYIQGKGKEDKSTFIKLTRPVYNAIQDYLKARNEKDVKKPLFASLNHATNGERLTTRSISRLIKNHLSNIGISSDRITAHSLRHTTATLNLLNGGTLMETQELLRHANINTTMIYSHLIDRENNKSEQRLSDLLFA